MTPRLARSILLQVLLCALPPSALLATGHAKLAGVSFWAVLCVTILRLALLGRCDDLLSLLVSLTPVMLLLRGFATYNIVVALLAGGLLYYYWRSARPISAVVCRCRLAVGLLMYISAYYALSLLFTGLYWMNLRMFEVVFMVVGVLVLGRRRRLLSVALRGWMVCSWAVAVAMMPYIETTDRLGMIMVEGHRLGNPVQLGGALSLSILALAVDGGRWLHLEGRRGILFGSVIVTTALLYLTTSRGAWLVVVACMLVVSVFGRGQRMRMLLAMAMLGLILQTLLLTRYGPGVQLGLDRTFGSDRSVRNRTSGRSDQWVVAYSAFTDSVGSFVYGHGPGTGAAVYARESLTVPGVEYAVGEEAPFHSVFMQVAVEAGVVGLVPLAAWLALILSRAFRWVRTCGEMLPLAAVVGYMCIGLTEGAQGAIAGVFLGVALLASGRRSRRGRAVSAQAGWTPLAFGSR